MEADKRFTETRELTSFLLNDLGEDLSELPGTLPLQKKVSETSARYLSILAEAATTDPSLDLEHAQGRIQLGDLLTQSGGRNLGDPVSGIKHFDTSINILERLAAAPDATPEIRKLLADQLVNKAYVHRFYYEDMSLLPEATARATTIYNDLLKNDPDNLEIKAALIDIRFEMWGFKNAQQGFAELDQDALAIKRDLEILYADDLSLDEYLTSYWSFLYLAGYAIASSKWDPPYGTVPIADREEYETVRDWVQTGFGYARQIMLDNPSNPEDLYTFFWALEPMVETTAMGLDWRPSLNTLDQYLTSYGSGRDAIRKAQQTDPVFAESLRIANELSVELATARDLLERLKPFDDNTFSYLQLVYATERSSALVHAGLSFDLDKAIQHLTNAIDIPNKYLQIQPDNMTVRRRSGLCALSESLPDGPT